MKLNPIKTDLTIRRIMQCYFVVIVVFFLSFCSHAELIATTRLTIYGHKPTLNNTGINKLGFSVAGMGSFNGSNLLKTLELSPGLTYGQITPWLASSFNINDYYDRDGDEYDTILVDNNRPATSVDLTLQWSDDNGPFSVVQSSILGCGAARTPTKLTVTINHLFVNSTMGDPRSSQAASFSKEYLVNLTEGVCFVKPANMAWINAAADNSGFVWADDSSPNMIHPIAGGGHQPEFLPSKGFTATHKPSFPTVGFAQAKFQLIMANANREYIFDSTQKNAASVDADGWVTLRSKPNGAVSITATRGDQTQYYTFTLSHWFTNGGTQASAFYPGMCAAPANTPTRQQVSNSPMALADTIPNGDNGYPLRSYYTRGIDGSLLGEWGNLQLSYPGSGWYTFPYWLLDSPGAGDQYRAAIDHGHITVESRGPSRGKICVQ